MSDLLSWPGKNIGLPAAGPGRVAPLWRRILAMCIDWGSACLISFSFFNYDSLILIAIFVSVRVLFMLTLSASFGQVITGVQVIRVDGKRLGFVPAVVRTGLSLLVLPAIILDDDNRGLHDLAAKTIVVNRIKA